MGDIVSYISLFITMLGFGVGLVKLFQTDKLVREAKRSVLDLSTRLRKYDLLTELNKSKAEIELLKELNTTNKDSSILYVRSRHSLIEFRNSYALLDKGAAWNFEQLHI